MNRHWSSVAIVVVAIAALVGCSDAPGTAEPASPSPTLRVIDEGDLAALVERNRGKIVLVDFWATWCPECMRLMPHAVELRGELGPERLAVILVSLDSPRSDQPIVRQALARNGVAFDSYISRYGGGLKSAEAFDIEAAAIPNIRVYDQKGELRKVFAAGRMPPEPFDAKDIEDMVRDLATQPR